MSLIFWFGYLIAPFLWVDLEKFKNSAAPTIFPELRNLCNKFCWWDSEVKIIPDMPYPKRITMERAWVSGQVAMGYPAGCYSPVCGCGTSLPC